MTAPTLPPCGPTHYAGCACHEARHASAIAARDAELANAHGVAQACELRADAAEQDAARYRDALLLVRRGLLSGAIKAKPIIDFAHDGEQAEITSVRAVIDAALASEPT